MTIFWRVFLYTATFFASFIFFTLADRRYPHWLRRKFWPSKTLLHTERWKVWANGQNFTAEDKPGSLPRHGRLWVHIDRIDPNVLLEKYGEEYPQQLEVNCLRIEWEWFSKRFEFCFRLEFSDTTDDALLLVFYIPFLLRLYIGIRRWAWVKRLLGSGWKWQPGGLDDESGRLETGSLREIGVQWYEGELWIYPWVNSYDGSGWIIINPADILFGQPQYSKAALTTDHSMILSLPEGDYPLTIELYTAIWKRPRWPIAQRVPRANITPQRPIPIPGKGDNGWDCGEDAVYDMTCSAASVEEAFRAFERDILQTREERGGRGWSPAAKGN